MTDQSAIQTLVSHVGRRWPDHQKFMEKSFDNRADDVVQVSEKLAQCILTLANDEEGGIDALCDDYRFLCEDIVLPEEIYFRRNGKYRLSSFDEAEAECYANAPFMARYMNGLLLSDVLWVNHASAFANFVTDYLPRLPENARHLEIGPGHGLFLYFASMHQNVASVAGWDISPTSIAKTAHALELLGARLEPKLELQNMFDAAPASDAELYDSITMSEILEHLEDPVAAVQAAGRFLRKGGTLFVNVPANSPAPDHIFLFEGLDHANEIVTRGGFAVEDSTAFPMGGVTLAQAVKHRLSVSCVVVGRKL